MAQRVLKSCLVLIVTVISEHSIEAHMHSQRTYEEFDYERDTWRVSQYGFVLCSETFGASAGIGNIFVLIRIFM